MLKSTKLVTGSNQKSPITESYKTLRTNIQFSSLDKDIKVILMTSSGPSEGKSTTAANLAITMAQDNKKVLLLDCDLRKPAVHRAFNILNEKGLTNILVGSVSYKKLCNNVGVENLEVITTGPKPPNPSEMLGSSKMKALIEELKTEYDVIILDTPPLLPVTDAAVLSRYTDGVILVTGYGRVTYDAAVRAKETLEKVGANILGVVINNIPGRSNFGYYYYYYYDEQGKGRKKHKVKRGYKEENVETKGRYR